MASLRTPLLLLLAALALSSVQAKKRGEGTAYSGEGPCCAHLTAGLALPRQWRRPAVGG